MSSPESVQVSWKEIVQSNPEDLQFANLQLHQASQFLAILGKNLVKQKPDDSNANVGIVESGLIGHKVEGNQSFHGFINISDFSLNLVDDEMRDLWSTPFDGKTRVQIMSELKNAITEIGQNGDSLKFIDHYKISVTHPIESGAPFQVPITDCLQTWHTIYSNAHAILEEVIKGFSNADEIRVWPHHFDIGSYIPLDKEGTKSIGLGLSIPDTMMDEFYFYIYGWRKEPSLDISSFPPLTVGEWKTGDWNGAVLGLSTLLGQNIEAQKKRALNFYQESVQSYLKALD